MTIMTITKVTKFWLIPDMIILAIIVPKDLIIKAIMMKIIMNKFMTKIMIKIMTKSTTKITTKI